MSEVILDRPADGIAVIRINRPEVRNALNLNVRELLANHFAALGNDDATRCIILTGSEKVFAAGADIRDMVERTPIEIMGRRGERLWDPIAKCPKPVIAAVNGFALGGGCELAMHADIIIAGEGASFGQPEVRVGIMPGAGGTQRLTRAVGKFRAMRMLLTGEPVTGARRAGDGPRQRSRCRRGGLQCGDESGDDDRIDAAAGGAADQGSRAGRAGCVARDGDRARAKSVSASLLDRTIRKKECARFSRSASRSFKDDERSIARATRWPFSSRSTR